MVYHAIAKYFSKDTTADRQKSAVGMAVVSGTVVGAALGAALGALVSVNLGESGLTTPMITPIVLVLCIITVVDNRQRVRPVSDKSVHLETVKKEKVLDVSDTIEDLETGRKP